MVFYIKSHKECANVPSDKHKTPTRNLCVDIFLSDFRRCITFYETAMKKIEPEEMSIDHTLKTSTRIEIPNSRHEKMSEKKKRLERHFRHFLSVVMKEAMLLHFV